MDVVHFVDDHMQNATVETIGQTHLGKDIPLVVLSDRTVQTPEEAAALGRPVILVVANIHAGETEGKDSMLRLLLDFYDGKHKELLNKITVLIMPIYNGDGNDDFSRTNRISQNGPDSVGTRHNNQGFDLNRDYTKIDAPESEALIGRVFTDWDPMLFVDLHTTNGSFHGYHLTYATPLNPNVHPAITEFQDRTMMPEIKRAMTAADWRIFEYGNFVRNQPDSGWATFSPQPRYGTNYYGMRNRLTLLSEAYSYLDYENRIAVTYDFVVKTLEFSAANAGALNTLRAQLDQAYDTPRADSSGTAFRLGDPVEESFYTGTVDTLFHEDIQRMTFRMQPEVQERTIRNFRSFVPTRFEAVPSAYYLDNRDGALDSVLVKLAQHGIAFDIAGDVIPGKTQYFNVISSERSPRAFQQRYLVTVKGEWADHETDLREWIKVPTNNKLRNLIFYLLEPSIDDGLFAWGFFDAALESDNRIRIVRELP